MTPPEPQPPATVGSQPINAYEVNNLIGTHLRGFVSSKNQINQDHNFLGGTDLKAAPYYFTDEQETLLKSAIADLDVALDAVDMTFISRIIGM
jgi:hypothetical protein